MGNGINFGIMVLARYLEERRSRKQEHVVALEISMRETVMPTFAAALAAAIAYGLHNKGTKNVLVYDLGGGIA